MSRVLKQFPIHCCAYEKEEDQKKRIKSKAQRCVYIGELTNTGEEVVSGQVRNL